RSSGPPTPRRIWSSALKRRIPIIRYHLINFRKENGKFCCSGKAKENRFWLKKILAYHEHPYHSLFYGVDRKLALCGHVRPLVDGFARIWKGAYADCDQSSDLPGWQNSDLWSIGGAYRFYIGGCYLQRLAAGPELAYRYAFDRDGTVYIPRSPLVGPYQSAAKALRSSFQKNGLLAVSARREFRRRNAERIFALRNGLYGTGDSTEYRKYLERCAIYAPLRPWNPSSYAVNWHRG